MDSVPGLIGLENKSRQFYLIWRSIYHGLPVTDLFHPNICTDYWKPWTNVQLRSKETFRMGSKVTNAHLQKSVHVRHPHTAMPAAWGSLLFLSTTCVVRSGICLVPPDSQLMLLTSKVKCDASFGIRQFMSQKPFMPDGQEEQKARMWDADHCRGSSLALWGLSVWSRSTEISRSSMHKKGPHHCAYVRQHHWYG